MTDSRRRDARITSVSLGDFEIDGVRYLFMDDEMRRLLRDGGFVFAPGFPNEDRKAIDPKGGE